MTWGIPWEPALKDGDNRPLPWVRISFVIGPARYLRAESFGVAASRIRCQHGMIRRFDWVEDAPVDPSLSMEE